MTDIVERLNDREQKLRQWIENSQVVVTLMQPELDRFEKRDGHNIYATRLAVDHVSSIRTQTVEADELAEAIAEITRLRELFVKYAKHEKHPHMCELLVHSDSECSCGLDDALATIKGDKS